MVGNFGSSDSAHSHLHFGKLQHGLLGLLLHLDGLGQRHTRQPHDLGSQGPFLKEWDEFPSHEWNESETAQHDRRRTGQDETAAPERPLQHGHIALFHPEREARFLHMVPAQKQRREYRRQGQRDHDRGQECNHQGVGQRREHFPFHAVESHERQEDDADDQNPEEDRPTHFFRRVEDHVELASPCRPFILRQVPIDVFDDDQRPICDFADGDGQSAERHQIRREPQSLHYDERNQRGNDERSRHDDRAADMAQEEKEHEDHQHDPFNQGISHRIDRCRHQFDAVVEG